MIRYPLLVGLAGPARCGKSTAQALLADEFGLVRLNFADPIKDALTTMLDIDFHSLEGAAKEEPLYHLGRSPRELMQTLGTEWGRHLCGSDWWIKVAERRLAMFEGIEGDAYSGAVISDVRFNEEADWVRNRGGLVVHLRRAELEPVRDHASELGIYPRAHDARVSNDHDLGELRRSLVRTVMHRTGMATCNA